MHALSYVSRLRTTMQQLRPVSTTHHTHRKAHVCKDLATCTQVFVHRDAVRKSLQPLYDGPFPVVERTPKYFILHRNGQDQSVSLDRLKPAHLELPSPVPAPTPLTHTPHPHPSPTPLTPVTQPPASEPALQSSEQPAHITRSGRRVHWPDRFTL